MYNPPSIISDLGQYLSHELPVEVEDLKRHLRGLEALRLPLAQARVDWLKLLHEKESQMLHPKDKELTEMDRKVMLNASVAVIRRDFEFLTTVENLVEQRLEFGRELLTQS